MFPHSIYNRLIYASIGLVSIILAGSFGYWLISGFEYDLFMCFYMTIITITSIGFGEMLDFNKYPAGRVFTIFVALSGVGLITYFLTNAAVLIVEGHLSESLKKRKMNKAITGLKDHYIVCGLDKYSTHLIEELISTGREYVAVETDKEAIKNVCSKLKIKYYIEGDASHDDILLEAGIKDARGVFASTTDDNMNLVISLSAKRLKPGIKVVALCFDVNKVEKLKLAGADTVVSPSYIGGLRMASEMIRPSVTTFLDVMLRDKNKNLRIEEIAVPEGFSGKSIKELRGNECKDILILAVRCENDWIYNPAENIRLENNNILIVLASPEERLRLEKAFS
jgi:voltage-gated potassium channel